MKGKIILLLSALTLVCGCKSQSKGEEKKFYSNLFDKTEKQEGEKFVKSDAEVAQTAEDVEAKAETASVVEAVLVGEKALPKVEETAVEAAPVADAQAAPAIAEQAPAAVILEETKAQTAETSAPAPVLDNK